jgi:hypothetical protein
MITFNFDSEFVNSRIKKKLLERVPIEFEQVHRYLSKAYLHLDASERIRIADLDGSYQLLYDSARKSLTSIFALHGLKPTALGGHSILHDVVIKCVSAEEVINFRKYDRLRRRRNFTEYLSDKSTEITLAIRDEDFLVAEYLYLRALDLFEVKLEDSELSDEK